jgi:hypothetical protein
MISRLKRKKAPESIGSDPWGTKFYLALAAIEIIKRYYSQEPVIVFGMIYILLKWRFNLTNESTKILTKH